MFVLVSCRHVGAYPYGLQHGVSIQIAINLGKTFLRISCLGKIAVNWILARGFAYLPSFFSQILDLNGFDFYFDLFWIAWHWKPTILFNIKSCHDRRTTNMLGSKMEGSLNQKSTAVKSCNILRSSHNTASSIRSREELRDMVTHVVTRECSDTRVLR